MHPYPEQIDCLWLASDRVGHLGAFITAGIGPIPEEALDAHYMPVEEIGGKLEKLPRFSQARLLVSVKRPDSYIELAERGMFVYDWTDIHRSSRAELKIYEAVAVSAQPLTLDSLPSDLTASIKIPSLSNVTFVAGKNVDVRKHLPCVEAKWPDSP